MIFTDTFGQFTGISCLFPSGNLHLKTIVKPNLRKLFSHVLVWAALSSLHFNYFPKLVRPGGPPPFRMEEFHQGPVSKDQAPPSPATPPKAMVVIVYISLIIFYYLNSLVLIPLLLSRQKRMEYALSVFGCCLLYTSDAADERSSVDLGGRRIIKKKKKVEGWGERWIE